MKFGEVIPSIDVYKGFEVKNQQLIFEGTRFLYETNAIFLNYSN